MRCTSSPIFGVALACSSIWTGEALACSVPVFRYALEHWAPDRYQALVFHRGPLPDSSQAGLRQWEHQEDLNLTVQQIDLAANPHPDLAKFWQTESAKPNVSLPWISLRFPLEVRLPGEIWSGSLTNTLPANVLNSPKREEVVQRLTSGQTAVWLLLESGQAAKDTAAAELLQKRLDYLSSVLELPKLDPADIANGLVSVGQEGLRLEFSTLRVSRDDNAEQTFIKMLLGTEADLADLKDPIVFPIFGRGRALYALVGAGINHETIDEAATFLIGKCSCQVKELNPGVDLLLAANWTKALQPESAPKTLPTLTNLTQELPVAVTISSDGETNAVAMAGQTKSGGFTTTQVTIAGGAALLALTAAALLWNRK